MADICAVCDKSMNFMTKNTRQGINIHFECLSEFDQNPEKYGGISLEQSGKEDSETVKIQKEWVQQKRKEREEKSVYIKGGINVKSFDMPFGDMVGFMVKWAIASIPAFIILAIIGAVFFAIFASL